MWNPKNKRNKLKHRLTDTEDNLVMARVEESWGVGGKGEGMKKYELVVTKSSLGHRVQHKEYSQ